jgi:anti-sigma-K factor RskA
VREFQDASTASLPPATPSEGLKSRVLAAATGQAKPRPALLSRAFWSAAAVFLFAVMAGNLFQEPDYDRSVDGKGTPDAPAAVGRVYWRENAVKLEIAGLPALPAGRRYQLWQIGPEKDPIGGRTFALAGGGELFGKDRMKYPVAKGQTFAITDEPAGGSRAPTGKLRFLASVN